MHILGIILASEVGLWNWQCQACYLLFQEYVGEKHLMLQKLDMWQGGYDFTKIMPRSSWVMMTPNPKL